MLETQEMWVRSLGWENLLEKEMATQYSCLENSMDRGAWQAMVHVVTKSQTQLSTHTYREHCLMNTHPIAEKSILTLSI